MPANVISPGCCGPVSDRIALIRQSHDMLVMGHQGLYALFSTLFADGPEEDREKYRKAADKHKEVYADLTELNKELWP